MVGINYFQYTNRIKRIAQVHVYQEICLVIIIIMYIYHALINALSAHMIQINLNMIFYTHTEHSPTETTHTKQDTETHTKKNNEFKCV